LGNDSGKTNVSASKPNHRITNGLAWLGRWSLSYYMLHQPVMIGALSAWVWFSRG
jgi:peptidoglycan/LPS O-acetylase OafA/YrhL